MYVNHNRLTTVTTEQICEQLLTNDSFLASCILALHDRQTQLEKIVKTTYVKNEVGYQQADAKMFSEFATKIRARLAQNMKLSECLTESEKRYARRPWARPRVPIATICKYRKQILDMIEERAAQLQQR